MRDLDVISGRFFEYDIPREKQYLLKYFTTDLQVAFLRYYLIFGESRMFVEHTGHYCSERLRFRLLARARRLMDLHEQARRAMTEESLATLQLLESGLYPLTRGEFS